MAAHEFNDVGAETPGGRRWYVTGFALALCLAAFLRFDHLTRRALWYDEVCTYYVVHHLPSWPVDGPKPERELAHRPYFGLLGLWTTLVGESAWGLRSFSALMGCAGVAVLAWTAGRMGGRSVGLITAALAAVHPLHIYYSQEARVYTMWALESVLCLYVAYRAATTLRTGWWIAYAIIAWISVATHYYTLLWLPATACGVLVTSNTRRFFRSWIATHAALALMLAPLVFFFILPLSEGGPKPWLEQTWAGYPPVLAISRSLWALLPAGGYPNYLGPLPVAFAAVSTVSGRFVEEVARWGPTVVVMGLAAIVACKRNCQAEERTEPSDFLGGRTSGVGNRRAMLFLMAVTLGFLAISWLFSFFITPAYVVGRYDFFAWPAVTIAIALLIDTSARSLRGGRRSVWSGRAVVTGLLVFCSGGTIVAARTVPAPNLTGRRADRIAALVGDEDLVISLGMYRWFMAYEWSRRGFAAEVLSFPQRHERQLCWADARAELAARDEIAEDVAVLGAKISRALNRGRHVWLLAHGKPSGPRWEVDRMLYDRLQELGYDIQPVDEWVGLARVVIP